MPNSSKKPNAPLRPINQWVCDAISHAGISQAELARRLAAMRVIPPDRSIANKMTINRDISQEEAVAISSATGFPLPLPESADTLSQEILAKFRLLSDRDQAAVLALVETLGARGE